MNKFTIIPSAILIPENMRAYGEIPSGLYPINGKPILDYIISQNKETKIIIASYQKSELIEAYAKNLLNVTNYKINELGDLGFTIYQTIKEKLIYNADSLTINFADTYIEDAQDYYNEDIIYYVESSNINKKWTYLYEQEGKIITCINKVNDEDYKGNLKLFVGLLNLKYPSYFYECLDLCKKENKCYFFEALKSYSVKHPFKFVKTNKWIDIGHPETNIESQTSIKARVFNHITIDNLRGIINKKSDDTEKFKGEILWYLKLPKNLQYCTPRIYDYSIDYSNMYVSMEYYTYHTLLDIYIYMVT